MDVAHCRWFFERLFSAFLVDWETKESDLASSGSKGSEEHALVDRIQMAVEKSTRLALEIDLFKATVQSLLVHIQSPPSPTSSSPTTTSPRPHKPSKQASNAAAELQSSVDKTIYQHKYLAEMLLKVILELDGVTCQPEFESARGKRKEAVRQVQALIDEVDSVIKPIKEYKKISARV
jgi:hypothetical protein